MLREYLWYCGIVAYLFNIQVYDKIPPVLFLTIQTRRFCEYSWLPIALNKLLKHYISLV